MSNKAIILLGMVLVGYSGYAGSLDPVAGPGSTMVTLQEIYDDLQAIKNPTNLSPGSSSVAEGYYEATDLTVVDPDLSPGNILEGTTIFGVAGAITNQGTGPVITPTSVVQSISAGYYSSSITVVGDEDLVADNIAEGVVVFGITGSLAGGGIFKTGQTSTRRSGDDGFYQKGVAYPNPRFTDHGDGTVTDHATGLMWTKSANPRGSSSNWDSAIDYCNSLDLAGYSDWRLPNVREMLSLVDYSQRNPPLPSGSPFTGLEAWQYWTSTYHAHDSFTTYRWYWNGFAGDTKYESTGNSYYAWPVRDAN